MPFNFNSDFGSNFGNSFSGGSFAVPRRRRSRKNTVEPKPDPSILRSLGEGALGVAGAVGNALDVPGSMVRDTLAGNNPFDQLLTPFSDKNRISGRDLARQYGLAGQKDTWGNFAGGLATEVATDPLTLLGVGFLGKTAQGAKLAKTGEAVAKGLGEGIRAGERALVSGKVPFIKGTEWALGTGEKAAKVGDKLDKAYGAVRYSAPGRATAAMFHAPSLGLPGEVGQRTGQRAYELSSNGRKWAKGVQLELARLSDAGNEAFTGAPGLMKPTKASNNANPKLLRDVFEGVADPNLIDPRIRSGVERMLKQNQLVNMLYGRGSGELRDNIKYFPRYVNEAIRKGNSVRGAKKLAGSSARDKARAELFKGWKSTNSIDEFFQDPNLKKILDRAVENKVTEKQALEALDSYIRLKHADKFEPMMDVVKGKGGQVLKQKDRVPYLAKYVLGASDDTLTHGLFGNNPYIDLHRKMVHDTDKIANIHAVNETLFNYLPEEIRALKGDRILTSADNAGAWKELKLPEKLVVPRTHDTQTLGSIYKSLKLDPRTAVGVMLEQHGISVNPETMAAGLRSRVTKDVAQELQDVFKRRAHPISENWMAKFWKGYSNLFKGFVLTHPARHTRDLIGGQIQNMLHGVSGPKGLWQAHNVYLGKAIKGLTEDPEIQEWVAKRGLKLNDQTATQALRFLYAEHGPGDVFKHTDVIGSANRSLHPDIAHVLGTVPGHRKSTTWGNIKDVGATLTGKKDGATWNPRKAKVRGVKDATESTFAPLAASDKISAYTDTMNRLAPFIELKRKGFSAQEAMNRINDVQVNYDPKTFTETEQFLKNIFPFYSYTSRMTKHVAKELAKNPGGGLANAIRVQNAARDRSGTTPDHVSQTASIPISESPDGNKRYLTGLGLMHEDALQFMQPSLHNFALESASRLNPLAQKAVEGVTGQSLYFKGPDGTRPINELDPTIGRILANVTGAKDAVRYPGDSVVEALVGLSPLSRVATTTRQLTDTRKGPGVKALNTLTGLKITDVSPAAQERTIRRKMEEKAKELGARTFSSIYFPKELTNDKQAAERIAEYKSVLKSLDGMAKKRKKRQDK